MPNALVCSPNPIIKLPLIQTIYDETAEMIVKKSLWEALYFQILPDHPFDVFIGQEERRISGFSS
jgi:hypothetical protein